MSVSFSAEEMTALKNRKFFQTKAMVTEKVYALFGQLRDGYRQICAESDFPFPGDTDIENGKIYRGENYRGYPWMVLDFPKLFSKESIFALRTMLWWGHFFSVTLHLQDRALKNVRQKLVSNVGKLAASDCCIGVNRTPWEYHYEADNYLPAHKLPPEQLQQLLMEKEFIKLSRKIEVHEYARLTAFGKESLKLYLELLL